MNEFVFESYGFDGKVASFRYRYNNLHYTEFATFDSSERYDEAVLERALFLAFLVIGTSYYKAFPVKNVRFEMGNIDVWQASFCNKVYQEGLSQYAFENQLTRDNLARFLPGPSAEVLQAVSYEGSGILALQSGGKDSLLLASLLEKAGKQFAPWYVTSSEGHPAVLDLFAEPLLVARRRIDVAALKEVTRLGGKNGHIPVTYVVLSLALIQAVLLGKNTVLAAIAHEGEEPHEWVGDLPINHQWSKTWQAEQLFADYVTRYISSDILVGSPLRSMSELKVTELFAENAWEKFGKKFSSCNESNYKQGVDNTELTWCGRCPKCANSYLLFAPFVAPDILQARLGGKLFEMPELTDAFKGLLGVDNVMKPFECVGEIDELRAAYHLAQQNGYETLPFAVPHSTFDKDARYDAQQWTKNIL